MTPIFHFLRSISSSPDKKMLSDHFFSKKIFFWWKKFFFSSKKFFFDVKMFFYIKKFFFCAKKIFFRQKNFFFDKKCCARHFFVISEGGGRAIHLRRFAARRHNPGLTLKTPRMSNFSTFFNFFDTKNEISFKANKCPFLSAFFCKKSHFFPPLKNLPANRPDSPY